MKALRMQLQHYLKLTISILKETCLLKNKSVIPKASQIGDEESSGFVHSKLRYSLSKYHLRFQLPINFQDPQCH